MSDVRDSDQRGVGAIILSGIALVVAIAAAVFALMRFISQNEVEKHLAKMREEEAERFHATLEELVVTQDELMATTKGALDTMLELFDAQMEEMMGLIEMATMNLEIPEIDLSHINVHQRIGAGFSILLDGVDRHLSGIRLRGLLQNELAVDRWDPAFEITVGESSQRFTATELLRAGKRVRITVYVPDVPVEKANTATVRFLPE